VTTGPWIYEAFPAALRADVAKVADAVPPSSFAPVGGFTVTVDGETVIIPHRIYSDVPPCETIPEGPLVRAISECLYTRHHDGHVRQRAVRALLTGPSAAAPWAVPFVVQLVGEYVVEVIDEIAGLLTELDVGGSAQHDTYGRVLAANPEFMRLTRSRVVSYWNWGYRQHYRRLQDYPGYRLIETLADAARARASDGPPSA
jgi:hypothetical protein